MFYLIGFLLLNLWIYILKNVKYNKEIALLNVTLLENRPSFRPMRNSFSGCIRLGVFLLLFSILVGCLVVPLTVGISRRGSRPFFIIKLSN